MLSITRKNGSQYFAWNKIHFFGKEEEKTETQLLLEQWYTQCLKGSSQSWLNLKRGRNIFFLSCKFEFEFALKILFDTIESDVCHC